MARFDILDGLQSSSPASVVSAASPEVSVEAYTDVQHEAPARDASPIQVSSVDAKKSTPSDRQGRMGAPPEPSPANSAPSPAQDMAPEGVIEIDADTNADESAAALNQPPPTESIEALAKPTSTMSPIIIDDGEDNEDNLSPPPSDSMSPPSSYLKAQTPKDSVAAETVASGSPPHVISDDEEQANGGNSGNNDRNALYTRRKRSSMFEDQTEKSPEETSAADEAIPHHPLRRPGQTNTARLVLVGYWRASSVPSIEKKHSVVCFIDTRDRLRTRVQTTTRKGHPVAVQYPMPSGGSWVPFEQIVFEDHLVGLDQAQVKEYVKIRSEIMDGEPSASDSAKADHKAVQEAIRRVKYGSQPDSGMPIAYGADIPEQPVGPFAAAKRRRTDHGFVPLAHNETNHHVGPIPFTSVGIAQNLQPLDPLPGTRPTRILIGYWHGSSEPEERDRHAVYGILGQNDMFRVKVVRETRDGRFVDGNFPSGAGALWIHYEEVILEPHILGMSRHEVKEYCRVRQWQIDRGESDEERHTNETFAVQEAQARVAHGFRTGQIVMMTKPPDDKVHLVPQISSGTQQYHELRPAPTATASREDARRTSTGRRSLPDSRVSTFRAINDPRSAEPSHQLPIANMTNISSYNGQSSASGSTPNANVTSIASQAFAAVNVDPGISHTMPAPVTATIQPPGNGVRMRFHDTPNKVPLRHLDSWSHKDLNQQQPMEQERQRTADLGRQRTVEIERQRSADMERQRSTINSEDAIIYAGVKYEKKKAGPFKDRHVSQGTIISINGEDYVEYRVLTKPTFF